MLKNLTLDLAPFIRRKCTQFDPDDFYRGAYESGAVQGKQFCLPPQININSMFVNKNHLQEAALAYPSESWTLPQFQDYAVKLTRRGATASGGDEADLRRSQDRSGHPVPARSHLGAPRCPYRQRPARWYDPRGSLPERTRLHLLQCIDQCRRAPPARRRHRPGLGPTAAGQRTRRLRRPGQRRRVPRGSPNQVPGASLDRHAGADF